MKQTLLFFLCLVFCTSQSQAQTDSLPDLPQLVVRDTSMIAFNKSSIRYFKKQDKYWNDYYYLVIDLTPRDIHRENSVLILAYASYDIAPRGDFHPQSFNRDYASVIGYTFIDGVTVVFRKRLGYYIPGLGWGGVFQFSEKSLRHLFDILKGNDTRPPTKVGEVSDGVYMISNTLYLTKDGKIKSAH